MSCYHTENCMFGGMMLPSTTLFKTSCISRVLGLLWLHVLFSPCHHALFISLRPLSVTNTTVQQLACSTLRPRDLMSALSPAVYFQSWDPLYHFNGLNACVFCMVCVLYTCFYDLQSTTLLPGQLSSRSNSRSNTLYRSFIAAAKNDLYGVPTNWLAIHCCFAKQTVYLYILENTEWLGHKRQTQLFNKMNFIFFFFIHKFGTTWAWVNNDRCFIFGWIMTLKCSFSHIKFVRNILEI